MYYGGARDGTGPKPRETVTRMKRLTITAPAAAVIEAKQVVQPPSMSSYISDLLVGDLATRRRERFGRLKHVTIEARTVVIIVPMDDCEIWKRTGWRLLSLDDGRQRATLKKVFGSNVAAQAVHDTLKRGGPS